MNFQEAPLFVPTPMVSTPSFAGVHFDSNQLLGPVDDNLMTALSRVSWVCTGIKSIVLWISDTRIVDYTRVFLECLFENIGRLHQLEELSLGAENGILTTSTISINREYLSNDFPGLLLFLKDLKLLSHVNLRNYGVSKSYGASKYNAGKITLKDIMFMIDSWPDLQHLTLQDRCLQAPERDKIADVTTRRGIKLSIFNDIIG
ncbi:hypothetical protein BGZ76_002491 [Entomortierella beljakovae]|nr:hypothetical protein BGZ76_002491 [Entomortierella beljakovae]